MTKKLFFYLLLFCSCSINAQEKDSLAFKNGIDNPSLLSTHHFGILISRINSNFKYHPSTKPVLSFSHASGNNHHPYMEAYFPKDPAVRDQLSQFSTWKGRKFNFIDQEKTPAEYTNIVVDAVIKEFRASISLPINKTQEINIGIRSYLITDGKQWHSPFTSDASIEWFHSNIAGGEDPFGRRFLGINQANINYLDRKGHTLKLNNNDFFIGGLEIAHYFYPKLKINSTRHIYINFGSHLGINTSKFNSSADFGVSNNIIKKFKLANNKDLNIALGSSVLRKNLVDFKQNIDFSNNIFLANFEGAIEYTRYTKKGHYNSITIQYQNQTRFNKLEETDYYVFKSGPFKKIFWYNGIYNLYKNQTNWMWIYTYGKPKYALSLYFKQDFVLNNAPDIQTGIGFKIPI